MSTILFVVSGGLMESEEMRMLQKMNNLSWFYAGPWVLRKKEQFKCCGQGRLPPNTSSSGWCEQKGRCAR